MTRICADCPAELQPATRGVRCNSCRNRHNARERHAKRKNDPEAYERWRKGVQAAQVASRTRNIEAGMTFDGKERRKALQGRKDAVSPAIVAAAQAPRQAKPSAPRAKAPKPAAPVPVKPDAPQVPYQPDKPYREKCPRCFGIVRNGVCRICSR